MVASLFKWFKRFSVIVSMRVQMSTTVDDGTQNLEKYKCIKIKLMFLLIGIQINKLAALDQY